MYHCNEARWLFPLFYKGYYETLSEDDLFPILNEHESTYLGNKIEKLWNKEINRKKSNFSLWRVLLKCFGAELGLLAIWYSFSELVVRLAQPLILSQILLYYEPHSTMSKGEAYLYSSLLVLSSAISMISQHNFMLYQFNMGLKIKVATTALVYRKSLKLSKSALAKTNIGQMVNLISNDVGRFETAIKHVHNLWLAPVELLIVMVLMYFYVGVSGIAGILFLIAFIPFQMWLGKKTSVFRLNTALKTDERIRLMNEIISGIQVIKMYTWEKPFAKFVEISRRKEMREIQKTSVIRAIIMSFHLFINKSAIYLCILVFVLTGNILNAQYVYVVTGFYGVLRIIISKRFPEAATQLAEAMISVRRIKVFLMMDEMEFDSSSTFYNNYNDKSSVLSNGFLKEPKSSENLVDLKNVSVKWNSELEDYSLENITMTASSGDLGVIIGPVGSGKTTLLYTILRELHPLVGSVHINGTVSYASQEPWLFTGSIRQNIIFGQDFNQDRYDQVIKSCSLESDFKLFPYGDRTVVGDRGASLSGGQRARINLARAIYKDADIYLLDDPLSAVDTHVGRYMFKECIQEYLKEKCVILVTHQLQYLKDVKKIYLMDSGKIDFSGTYEEIAKSEKEFAQLFKDLKVSESEETNDKDDSDENMKDGIEERKEIKDTKESSNKEPKDNRENRELGTISFGVYKVYLASGGHWCKVVWILLVFLFAQLFSSISDYYVTWWVNGEAIKKSRGEIRGLDLSNTTNPPEIFTNTSTSELNKTVETSAFQEFWLNNMTEELCIMVYSGVVIFLIVFAMARSLFFFTFCIKASKKLHNSMFDKIVYAKMLFFNTNPFGRILNRFSKDMNQVDEVLPITLIDTIQNGLTVLFTTIVVATVNPWMLIPTVIILFLFYLLRVIYMATSRDIKRVESTTRSPVYSHFTASLQGLTTIRAFGAQTILSKEFDAHQNRNSSAFTTFLALGRCFGLWLDFQCVIYIGLVTMSFLIFKTDALGGFVGLSITQSLTLTGMFQWCMRQWGELENAMTSVERIREYIDIDPETTKVTKDPPSDWPSEGNITFKNLSLRYDIGEPKVLKNLTFSIKGKEKVGVVGRTGAGKSSLIIALFRLAENEGIIAIDDIDISTISLECLRSKISIIPQEPVLFAGTLRKNLDPFDDYDDKVLWNALEEVELKDVVSDLPSGLESRIIEGGSNFSVGQRQLVCLARAIIRKNRILVLDEATANVDPQTDALIQSTIRNKFADCTVITIAHRLHTIMDSDKILVMNAGEIVEFGKPFELLENTNGQFYDMVQQTGKAMTENLLSIAERTYKGVPM